MFDKTRILSALLVLITRGFAVADPGRMVRVNGNNAKQYGLSFEAIKSQFEHQKNVEIDEDVIVIFHEESSTVDLSTFDGDSFTLPIELVSDANPNVTTGHGG